MMDFETEDETNPFLLKILLTGHGVYRGNKNQIRTILYIKFKASLSYRRPTSKYNSSKICFSFGRMIFDIAID